MELGSESELSIDDMDVNHKEGIKWPLEEAVLHSWVGVKVHKILKTQRGRRTSATDICIAKVWIFK